VILCLVMLLCCYDTLSKSMKTKYLTPGPVSQNQITASIDKRSQETDSGAHSIFLGQVRSDEIEGRKVKAIEYSAYIELVNVEAEKIINKILSEHGDVRSVDIIHSTGVVKAGEISLLVFVSAIHRQQAMEACSMAVELIKENLPVWKKEIFEDESHLWK
jgi:molybdopterin synthase catalytic subunit